MTVNDTSGVNCIGIIMDGNRRFARAHDLPVFEGHIEGYKRLQELLRWAHAAEIPHIAVYAFSTENWNRSEKEVGYLMSLFRSILENETEQMITDHVWVRFVGDRKRFSADIQHLMEKMEEATAKSYELTLHLLMSYGGRAELVAAVNALSGGGAVTEDSLAEKLWSHALPDIDLIIRTGGEKRLSNFLPWQSAYSELFFSDTFWPDFSRDEFETILKEFSIRERRHGK